jgi:hypothetical protein
MVAVMTGMMIVMSRNLQHVSGLVHQTDTGWKRFNPASCGNRLPIARLNLVPFESRDDHVDRVPQAERPRRVNETQHPELVRIRRQTRGQDRKA